MVRARWKRACASLLKTRFSRQLFGTTLWAPHSWTSRQESRCCFMVAKPFCSSRDRYMKSPALGPSLQMKNMIPMGTLSFWLNSRCRRSRSSWSWHLGWKKIPVLRQRRRRGSPCKSTSGVIQLEMILRPPWEIRVKHLGPYIGSPHGAPCGPLVFPSTTCLPFNNSAAQQADILALRANIGRCCGSRPAKENVGGGHSQICYDFNSEKGCHRPKCIFEHREFTEEHKAEQAESVKRTAKMKCEYCFKSGHALSSCRKKLAAEKLPNT